MNSHAGTTQLRQIVHQYNTKAIANHAIKQQKQVIGNYYTTMFALIY